MKLGKNKREKLLAEVRSTLTKKRFAWFPTQMDDGQWILFEKYYSKEHKFQDFRYREYLNSDFMPDETYDKAVLKSSEYYKHWKAIDADIEDWLKVKEAK